MNANANMIRNSNMSLNNMNNNMMMNNYMNMNNNPMMNQNMMPPKVIIMRQNTSPNMQMGQNMMNQQMQKIINMGNYQTGANNNKIGPELANKIINKLYLKIYIDKNEEGGPIIKKEEFFYGENKLKIRKESLHKEANYEELTQEEKKYENLYKNYTRLLKVLEEIEEYITNSNIPFNPLIELEFTNENNAIDSENNKGEHRQYNNITLISRFKNQIGKKDIMEFLDRDILICGIGTKSQGFIYLINELTNEDYENETFVYDN